MRRSVLLPLLVVAALVGGLGTTGPLVGSAAAGAPFAPVVLTTPPDGTRGHPLWDSYFDLDPFGYTEEEFLVSGTAVDADGGTAPFTTRIIVTRPADAADFSGTVFLDWVNVTAQFENAVDTMLAREYLLREGHAYVHASVQEVGLCCLPLLTPTQWDPVRYAAIDHPGDAFAHSIFTQLARAFRQPAAPASLDPMGSIGVGGVEQVIAMGQSQSAIQLHGYLNEWLPDHPGDVGVVDGFLVHGNVFQPKTFDVPIPVPVLNLLSDLEAADDGVDLETGLDPNVRVWEVAGSAHADLFVAYQSEFGHGPRVLAGADKIDPTAFAALLDSAGNFGEAHEPLFAVCIAGGTSFPMRYATSTALHRLDEWVRTGVAPPSGPRYEFSNGTLARDADGNTLGGIRLPPIDVPLAEYRSTDCQLGGTTRPFTEAELLARYGDFGTYFAQVSEATAASVAAGWLLPADAGDLLRRACEARIRFLEPDAECVAPTSDPTSTESTPTPDAGGDPTAAAPADGEVAAASAGTHPGTGGAPPLAVALLTAVAGLAVARLRRA